MNPQPWTPITAEDVEEWVSGIFNCEDIASKINERHEASVEYLKKDIHYTGKEAERLTMDDLAKNLTFIGLIEDALQGAKEEEEQTTLKDELIKRGQYHPKIAKQLEDIEMEEDDGL